MRKLFGDNKCIFYLYVINATVGAIVLIENLLGFARFFPPQDDGEAFFYE